MASLAAARPNICGWVLDLDIGEASLFWGSDLMAVAAIDTSSNQRLFRLVTNTVTNEASVLVDGQPLFTDVAQGAQCFTPGVFSQFAAFGQRIDGEAGISEWSHVIHNLQEKEGEFCAVGNVLNSLGQVATLDYAGSRRALDNDLTLRASGLPPGTFGIAICSRNLIPFPLPAPTTNGLVCLRSPIARLMGPGQIVQSSPVGTAEVAVDLNAIALPGGAVTVLAGDTWAFQFWYRDAIPQATSNFTSGLQLYFE